MLTQSVVSSSRTYVAICNNGNFDGHYFRKFTLPKTMEEVPAHARGFAAVHELIADEKRNNSEFASWYFLNVLNYSACIDGCFTFEDFQDITDQVEVNKKIEAMLK